MKLSDERAAFTECFDKMEDEEIEEFKILKEYNQYLNDAGLKRLVYLWNKDEKEQEERKKNGM